MAIDFPPIYLLKCGFEKAPHDLHRLERQIGVVWNIKEADLVLGRLSHKTRAEHELRKLGLFTEDVDAGFASDESDPDVPSPAKKRRKVDVTHEDREEIISLDSNAEPGPDNYTSAEVDFPTEPAKSIQRHEKPLVKPGTIKVLKHVWFANSLEAGKLLPVDKYLVYEGRIVDAPKPAPTKKKSVRLPSVGSSSRPPDTHSRPSQRSFHQYQRSRGRNHTSSQPALLQETTEDHEAVLPSIPEYLHTKFCCERPTPLNCPNEEFLAQLRIMKKGRMLEGESMRERAYNSAIATVASYPYTITSPFEITRLPNCGDKIGIQWNDWKESGYIKEAQAFLNDEKFRALSLFYDIHDVGYKSALKFWNKGWRDLDDVIEYGWDTLTRTQQIGVKYCSEFQQRIPRTEVEGIAATVLKYVNRIHPGFQMVICGGYRRGKADSGDVDVILSHPDEEATDFVLETLLGALEESRYITHRLEYAVTNSKRGQNPLGWKGLVPKARSGFDTLDHAFVVWQEPSWVTEDEDLSPNPVAPNPNVHRRVDIIVSPWKTAGCAVLGWTGGTMFERDLRSYSRKMLGWKFDSSGVRDVATGEWIDLEKGAEDMLAKERKVFEGLKLEWREPTERCTD